MATMTREQMEEVINQGGSVLHEGRLHTNLQTLPSKADLATSAEDKKAAASEIDEQIEALQKQRAALGDGETVTKKEQTNSKNQSKKAE